MRLQTYRDVLQRPGVRSLLLVCLLARIPVTAAPIALTLHVVLDLHLGFASSGTIAGLTAVGAAVGAPLIGSAIDRIGLRPILVVATIADGTFWLCADHLSFLGLLPAAFAIGAFSLPVFTLSRQSLAALVPPGQRQAGFSLDSMSVEVSFAVGPALGVVSLTQLGSSVTFTLLAALLVTAGLVLFRLNPPVHGEEGVAPGATRPIPTARPTARQWMNGRVLAVLLATFGATLTLVGTDAAFTASMRSFHEISLLGVVTAVWCVASLLGGFVYGMAHRTIEPLLLLTLLAGLTIPVGLAQNWWLLALLAIPTGVFCAPLISATAEVLTEATPANVRGQVMGVHASALTVGNAVGAPFVGLVMDHSAPAWGFVAIGCAGLSIGLLGLLAQSRRRRVNDLGPDPATAPAPIAPAAAARL